MNGKGEKKCYYQLRSYSNLNMEQFTEKICYPGSGLNRGDVARVLCRMVDTMKEWLSLGHTITIDELGTFSLSIGVDDDQEVEDFEGNGKRVTGKRISVRGVNFRPNRDFVRDLNRRTELHRGGVSPVNRSPYTQEERLQLALRYLEEKSLMRVREYQSITHLPHTTAAQELKAFAQDPDSGITYTGRGNTKVYILRK